MKPSTPGFIGKRLREARELRGLTAASLAELLGVSRQSVSKYEKGLQSPSPEVLEEICSQLGMPLAFFVNDRLNTIDGGSPVFYRSFSSATKKSRDKAEGKKEILKDLVCYLEGFIEFPTVNLPKLSIPSDPLEISEEFIESIAVSTRRQWGLGDGPISNTVWLLENNGVIISRCSLESRFLDAFSQNWKIRPLVILGDDKASSSRSRFDVGHELGHLILHRNISEASIRDPDVLKVIEAQANFFSGVFLFPSDAFRKEVKRVSLEGLRLLKPIWKLSIGMMLNRAKQLGIIDEDKSTSLWKSYGRRGWRKNEPYDDTLPLEQPKLLSNAFKLLIEEGLQSRSDILHVLKLSSTDIEELANLDAGFLNQLSTDVVKLFPRKPNESSTSSSLNHSQNKGRGEVIPFPSRQN